MSTKTFRFTFSETVCQELSHFASLHKYDEKTAYKDAWETWIAEPEIQDMIDQETKHLKQKGFEGDVVENMYKSARYYYRKKVTKEEDEPQENPKKRKPRQYGGFSKEFLKTMDAHISETAGKLSPAELYTEFCNSKQENILAEFIRILQPGEPAKTHVLSQKLKKTYKNRYYIRGTEGSP